jgi:chromosome segregation ATPase
MTGNGVTASDVNHRVDKMANYCKDMSDRIKHLERSYMTHINENMQEYVGLAAEMDALQINIDAAPSVKQLATVELAELRDRMTGVEEQLDDIEAELYLNVTAEIDDDNKLVYTNESSRKAALRLAKRHNDEYQEIKGQLDKLTLDKARLEAQLREIEERDKASRAIFRGCVARVENVTARISL